jgi:hypothetical protein
MTGLIKQGLQPVYARRRGTRRRRGDLQNKEATSRKRLIII